MNESDALRVGIAADLSARPLIEGLSEVPQVTLDHRPARDLRESISIGAIDAALLPPLEAFRCPQSRLLPGIGVAVEGAARSELLLSRVPPDQIHSISAPADTQHWAALAGMFVAERHGIPLPAIMRRESSRPNGVDADALAIGGDAGLRNTLVYEYCTDLGALWQEMTGLPLVLWQWVACFRAPYPRLRCVLAAAQQRGMERLETLAAVAPVDHGIATPDAATYLTHTLRFRTASLEADGLRALLALANKYGCCPSGMRLEYC